MSLFLRKRAEMALHNSLYGSLWGTGNLESICELMPHRSSIKMLGELLDSSKGMVKT